MRVVLLTSVYGFTVYCRICDCVKADSRTAVACSCRGHAARTPFSATTTKAWPLEASEALPLVNAVKDAAARELCEAKIEMKIAWMETDHGVVQP
eukprot:7224812-Prymnesium_polylepis.1